MTTKKRTNRNVKGVTKHKGRILYKVFKKDFRSPYGRDLKWSKPKGARPGGWQVHQGPLAMCSSGLHVLVGMKEVIRFYDNSSRMHCSNRATDVLVYRVEAAGISDANICGRYNSYAYSKAVASHVRLVRRIRPGSAEWRRIWSYR